MTDLLDELAAAERAMRAMGDHDMVNLLAKASKEQRRHASHAPGMRGSDMLGPLAPYYAGRGVTVATEGVADQPKGAL